ncbi:sugar ABC transporter substrate-binding protein [Geodermatophilus sp. DF01-2]|uniref:sugar ABC transporter substrate-binding protein n=1 Tax=Geodermatophilus sp. DF01-2 TaxID=2559610 RepID=UPI001073B154|nr:substrate-binding domain-containing protein [Geodermatophilus sp. DF01_2]TFV62199.1 sugar ABC transporter substrate-binding protein [Geodermatophilus sp. DF01_2]
MASLSLVAACGGSEADAEAGAGAEGSGTDSEIVAEAQAAVEQNRRGTDRALPDSSPAPLPDQNIWVISCLEAGEGCSAPAAGAKEAGEALGWDVTVFDGKGTPDGFAEGIRTAIADQADGIILDVVDCVAAKSALEEAKAAGIPIYAFYSLDCDDPLLGEGGEPLFDAELQYEEGRTYAEQVEDVYSKSVADYVIAETDGQAKVIQFIEDDILVAQHLYKGFARHLEPCGGCEIVAQVPFTLTDLATGQLRAKAAAALTQHPDANVVYVPYDAALTLGIAQAVTASGRDDELLVTGGEGLSPNIGFVREGKGQDMIAGAPARWVGWAAIDGMNRLLQGEEQVDPGIGLQTLDTSSPSLPTETTFYDGNIDEEGKPTQDYEANYRRIWGLS